MNKRVDFDGKSSPRNTKLLILDLDETLIFGTEDALDAPPDFSVGAFYIYARPHVREFLSFCSEHYRIAVWSTGSEGYVRQVLAAVTDGGHPFAFVWSRNRCTLKGLGDDGELRWLKDLKKVHKLGWSLEQVLMLEDTPQNLARHYGNVIPIRPFTGDQADVELKRIMPFLLKLKEADNVRCIEKRSW
jgi:RNA polymerase II subunit A small phosphatase-like protein